MAERQVTVERETMPLPKPFLVLATQNPVELEGTFPLPEAQPTVLLLLLCSLVFAGQSDVILLVEGSITLLIVSLYWWAMLVKHRIQPRFGEKWVNLLQLPGLFVSLVVILGTRPPFSVNTAQFVLSAALATWLWWRSIVWIREGLREEQLTNSLKVGVLVILVMLFFAVVSPQPIPETLLNVLAYTLPIYFLSGLIALSYSHLGTIKREYLRRSPNSQQADPTGTWAIILSFLWLVTVVLMIILEVTAFGPLESVLSPLLNTLRAFLYWLLSLLVPLSPLPSHSPKAPVIIPYVPFQPPLNTGYTLNSAILQLILVMLLLLFALVALIVLLFIVRNFLSKRKSTPDVDEVRESVSVRSIVKARRKQRQKHLAGALEPLDPTSARAHYREFLQMMAQQGKDLGRHLDETPSEYQTRLLTLVEHVPTNDPEKDNTLEETALLNELTLAYTLERYGGKSTANSQQACVHRRVSRLVKRLTSSTSP